MTSAADATLGKAVREHPTDNARRRSAGLTMLFVGVLFTAIGIPVTVHDFNSSYHPPGPSILPGALLGIGLAGLGYGIARLTQAARGRGEAFLVYEQGLVHRRSGAETVIRWTDVASVRESGTDKGPARFLGNDVDCRVRLKQGAEVRFTGYTAGAEQLAGMITRAVKDGHHPEAGPKRSRWDG